MAEQVMVSVNEDFSEVEELLVERGFELIATGVGSFEYVIDKGKEGDIDELVKTLAEMIIRVRVLEVDDDE
jgi:hypothetical protein